MLRGGVDAGIRGVPEREGGLIADPLCDAEWYLGDITRYVLELTFSINLGYSLKRRIIEIKWDYQTIFLFEPVSYRCFFSILLLTDA